MANFQDILNQKAADVEAPVPLPIGTYLGVVDGLPEFSKIGTKQTDCVNFKCKLMQAQPDVDQAQMLEALKGKALSDRYLTVRQFITEDAKWRLRKFLEDCGLELGTKSLGELIPEAAGRQVLLSVGHRPSEDGTQIFMDVKGTAKV